eukprot:2132466-Rhodomonas_salina.1
MVTCAETETQCKQTAFVPRSSWADPAPYVAYCRAIKTYVDLDAAGPSDAPTIDYRNPAY